MENKITGYLSISYKTYPFEGITEAKGSFAQEGFDIDLGSDVYPNKNNGIIVDHQLLQIAFIKLALKKAKELNQDWKISNIYLSGSI